MSKLPLFVPSCSPFLQAVRTARETPFLCQCLSFSAGAEFIQLSFSAPVDIFKNLHFCFCRKASHVFSSRPHFGCLFLIHALTAVRHAASGIAGTTSKHTAPQARAVALSSRVSAVAP